MSFDLGRVLRRFKPQHRVAPLVRRGDDEVAFADDADAAGAEIMLDTCVYIDALQGRTPAAVDGLLRTRICNHSAICLAELTHLFGRLSPDHPETPGVLERVGGVIADIPPHRLTAPSAQAIAEAGILAGMAFRLGDFQRGQEQRLLNDAILYLHALERGQIVLTRNIRDFDVLQQVLPSGRVLFYRANG